MKRLLTLFIAILVGVFSLISLVQAQNTAPWSAQYFNNTTLSGVPVATTSINSLNVNWGTGIPAQGMSNTNWSARFATNSFFNPGYYVFSILADDGFTLRINNVIVADTYNNPQPGKTITVVVPIQQGNQQIQIDFVQYQGVAFLFTNWYFQKPLDGGSGFVPPPPVQPTALPPGSVVPSATSVTTQYGDFTPCIQQGIHQVNCFVPSGSWDGIDSGSIAIEPQIMIWGQCTPDQIVQQQVFVGQPVQRTKCSKTGAGYYIY